MWEPDEAIIGQLKSLFFDELPSKIARAKAQAERERLAEERSKVGNLLQNGYGLSLCREESPVTSESRSTGKPQARAALRDTSRLEGPGLSGRARFASAGDSLMVKKSKKATEVLANKVACESAPQGRKASLAEERKSIEKLRREYLVEIPSQLSSNISDDERAKLQIRHANICRVLERGYRVSSDGS